MITHVVLYRFHDSADVDAALERLRGMAGTIPALRSVRAGRNVNTGEFAYELVLVTEHDSAEQLAAYQADPAHQEVLGWMRSRVKDRAVVDTVDLA